MKEDKYITWENQDGIGLLTLNRPKKHNALNSKMITEIATKLEKCYVDEDVKVIVLQGIGESFCSGGDLTEHPFLTTENDRLKEQYIRDNHRIIRCVRRLPQPVICALHGMVSGAGLDLSMACDIRIAAENSRLGVLFTHLGLIPDMGGTDALPRLVGLNKALEMLFTGDLIDAIEAQRIGLVNRVVNKKELEYEVMAFALRLARGPLQSYRMNKRAVYRSIESQLEIALENEISGQCELSHTEDVREAINAFKNKRKPAFRGC
ncbi:MAG: enoyl-CoA hydratase [Desulfobacterales bacterium]|jgi:2-(1,2-epoxy-1,2-dihydrophenyl)acetyl-CoA isomerase|nr:enoyl-CoA hydratase [Desulfobacteraceae bacterium]MBT7086923.1 enoyl-CoA hydratase [Desulfobacterales bacterium]MBT7698581.1 enoyl-CoA hydratase [Desulfobacterales bacterium]